MEEIQSKQHFEFITFNACYLFLLPITKVINHSTEEKNIFNKPDMLNTLCGCLIGHIKVSF